MNKISIISIITLIIVFFTYTILQRSRAQTVTLQSEQKRFLLLDSRIVESSQNAKLEVGTVEKYKVNPLLEKIRSGKCALIIFMEMLCLMKKMVFTNVGIALLL